MIRNDSGAIKTILVLFLFLGFSENVLPTKNETEQIEYYLKLLATENERAKNFVLPTDNRRYFGDIVPDKTLDFGEFDFIIVGGGSSGSVIVNRLSKVNRWKILLLEAGGNETDFSDIPQALFSLELSEMNWGYNTTSQKNSCLGMINNQCFYPRGRVLGGSGAINALMYVRGNKEDYNTWEAQGNPGWSYESVLPFFKKSEHSELDDADTPYHSTSGLWNVTYAKPPEPFTENFFKASQEMGYSYLDYNGENQMGYSRLQFNVNNGKRASGGRSFIDPVRSQSNVYIVTNALVSKVLINKEDSAYGVTFLKDGNLYKATVSKEVIISAGTINTPQLLMLSGIGPKEHLEELNIPIIKDLPVGQNLRDHAVFTSLIFKTNYTFVRPSPVELVQNYLHGQGLLTYCAQTHGIKFVNTLKPESEVPDIEYIFIPPPSASDLSGKVYNLKQEVIDTIVNKQNGSTDFRILIVLLHPKSKGDVTLQSNNPLDFPNINTNYFTDENDEDVETMYRAIIHALTMLDTEAFKAINATLRFDFPVCDEYGTYSRDYWHCAIKYLTSTLYHPSGTTRMGPDPKTSVVNHELKVHGIENLRIGDCGVIPESTSGHTNAPAFMIGEKLSDFLKQRYQ